VLAVGSPGGLDNTITWGIVSAVGRQPHPDMPMVYIQTDAAINPGNSGGALLDVAGNLLGINTLILSQTGGNQALGFAVPAPVVRYVYEQLRSHGTVRRSVIGVNMQTITPALAQGIDLGQAHRVIISDVLPGTPAALAGLRAQDIVTQVDGTTVVSLPYFVATMYMHDPATPVSLTVLRGRETLHFDVTAASSDDVDGDDPDASIDLSYSAISEFGIFGKTVTPALVSRFHLRSTKTSTLWPPRPKMMTLIREWRPELCAAGIARKWILYTKAAGQTIDSRIVLYQNSEPLELVS
jgi:hypothetical protein